MACTTVRHLERGETLFLQGEDATFIPLILNGWIVVYRDTPDGERTVVHVFHTGESFGEPASLGLGAFPASAEAASQAQVALLPGAMIKDWISRDGALGLQVIATMSMRLHSMVEEMERRNFMATDARLAAFLCDQTPTKAGPVTLLLPYDKGLVAARLGMKPESLSRALGKLKSLGVSSKGAEIMIDDMAKLRQKAASDQA